MKFAVYESAIKHLTNTYKHSQTLTNNDHVGCFFFHWSSSQTLWDLSIFLWWEKQCFLKRVYCCLFSSWNIFSKLIQCLLKLWR